MTRSFAINIIAALLDDHNKRILVSFIVPVIQHGRQFLCHLNLTGLVANHLFGGFESQNRVEQSGEIMNIDK